MKNVNKKLIFKVYIIFFIMVISLYTSVLNQNFVYAEGKWRYEYMSTSTSNYNTFIESLRVLQDHFEKKKRDLWDYLTNDLNPRISVCMDKALEIQDSSGIWAGLDYMHLNCDPLDAEQKKVYEQLQYLMALNTELNIAISKAESGLCSSFSNCIPQNILQTYKNNEHLNENDKKLMEEIIGTIVGEAATAVAGGAIVALTKKASVFAQSVAGAVGILLTHLIFPSTAVSK